MRDFNKRNKKGQFKPEIDYYKIITIGIVTLTFALYISFNLKITVEVKPIVDTVEAQTVEVTETPTITPTQSPQITTKPVSKNIKEKICAAFGSKCADALKIAQFESGIRSIRSYKSNTNGTYDWGIFQINDIHCKKLNLGGDCTKLLDEDTNIAMAVLISGKGTTWTAWSTCRLLPRCY